MQLRKERNECEPIEVNIHVFVSLALRCALLLGQCCVCVCSERMRFERKLFKSRTYLSFSVGLYKFNSFVCGFSYKTRFVGCCLKFEWDARRQTRLCICVRSTKLPSRSRYNHWISRALTKTTVRCSSYNKLMEWPYSQCSACCFFLLLFILISTCVHIRIFRREIPAAGRCKESQHDTRFTYFNRTLSLTYVFYSAAPFSKR